MVKFPLTKYCKMRKYLFLSLLAFSFFACKDDDQPSNTDATVHMNFKAAYEGNPLVLYQALDYPDGNKIRFQNFNFFVSNVTLLGDGDTPDYLLSEVEFIDFGGNLDLTAAQSPQTLEYKKVPPGTYRGISIDFGVPAELNNSEAGSLPSDNPLRQAFTTHFWTDWGSFIFMKSEGIYDLNGDGTFNQSDQGFEHHPGMDDVLKSVTKLKSFTLEEGKTFDLDLVADLFDIYVENGVPLDLSDPANKDTQEAIDLPLAIELMSHWEQALKF